MRCFPAILLLLLLASCAAPEPAAPPLAEESPSPAVPKIQSQPLKYLVGRTLKPIPDKELEVRTKCSFRDVGGGRGAMDLQVSKAEVKRFVAEVNIPRRGVCRFDKKDFQQTAKLPNVVLTDESTGCVVRMWEQEKGITVSFNACQAKCGGDAFSYLWPILVDRRSGRCS